MKTSNTAGVFSEPPPEEIDNWEQRGDGKWYWVGAGNDGVPVDEEMFLNAIRGPQHPECGQATRDELMRDLAGEFDIDDDKKAAGIGDVTSSEKGSGARFNTGKPPMQYIPFEQQLKVFATYWVSAPETGYLRELMEQLSRFEKGDDGALVEIIAGLEITDLHAASYVWEYGANKYAAWNWAKGMPWSVPLACISRHIQAIVIEREEIDAESECEHWGHIVCNLLMLDHYSRYWREGDDRPPKEVFSRG